MTSKHHILLLIFCFSLTISAFSQTKEITREDYYQPFRLGLKKKSATSRRVITRQENYREGKLFSTTEITDEFLVPNKRHYMEVEKFADHTNKSELIQIGEVYYCRRNDGELKQSQSWCSGGSASGLSNIVSSKFTVEDTKINNKTSKFYKNYTIYKNIHSPNKDKEGLSYYQHNFWIDSNGFILREEMRSGLLEPERIYRQMTNIYEYNPQNLKIEAPIK